MKQTITILVAVVIVAVVAVAAYTGSQLLGNPGSTTSLGSGKVVKVVAAQNFWGSLVSQLGGSHVSVLSIVSDPNADPHTYESNAADARAFATADLVIVNGAGYDAWALRLIAAGNVSNRMVLNVQLLLNQPADVNPHFWYSPVFVNATVKGIYNDLVSIDSADASYFKQQYAGLNASLYQSYMSREVTIKHLFAGAHVAATENIFVYMANATGLFVVSPPEFMKAVAEGNDPSPQDVATFQALLKGGNSSVRVLVYNQQTVTPLTDSIKAEAAQYHIPIVGVTETIQPSDITFQAWMGAELIFLQNALNSDALGK